MKLTARLEGPNGTTDARTLDAGALTIGRGPENDWVLPDPERTLSKRHCRIDRSDSGYLLSDLSTNGVFVAGDPGPVGRGRSRQLGDGDVIVLGPYNLHIAISTVSEALTDAMALPNLFGTAAAAGGFTGLGQTPIGPSGHSPIQPPPQAPWLDAIPTGEFGPGLRPAREGWDAPPDPSDWAASGLRKTEDPLGSGPTAFSDTDQHVAAISELIRLPASNRVLPPDWNEGAEAAPEPPRPAAAPSLPPLIPEPVDFAPPPGPTPIPFVEPLAPAPAPPTPSFTAPAAAAPVPLPPAAFPFQIAPAAPAPMAASVPTTAGDAALLIAAFVAGAGLPAGTLAHSDPLVAFHEIGQLVRTAIDGVREILMTRAMVKAEFRVDKTVVQSSNNSPLKFVPDVDRCVAAMVGETPAGFMRGPAALEQSLADIKRHELAMVAAVNTVVAELATQLNPETIRARVDGDSSWMDVVPAAKRARYWTVFEEIFEHMSDSTAATGMEPLLAMFADAYVKQIRRA